MSINLDDVISKKKAIGFIMILILSLVILMLQNSMENLLLDLFQNVITQISYFMIYIGVIIILMSSVTWKWKRVKNEETKQYEYVERKNETPQSEFDRRRLFALGIFSSVYGTAIQAFVAFMP